MTSARLFLAGSLLWGCSASETPVEQPPPQTAPTPIAWTAPPPQDVLSPELSQLVAQLLLDNPQNREVALKIAASGSEPAKVRAASKLVTIADHVTGQSYRQKLERENRERNQRLGFTPSPAMIEEQLESAQTEALTPHALALLELGTEPAVQWGFKIARDPALLPKRRSLGLAILEKYVPPSDPARGAERSALSSEINKKLAASQQGSAQLSDTAETISKLRPALKACHDQAVAKSKGVSEKVTLALKVDTTGAVIEATAKDVSQPELKTCLENVARKAKFAPPAQVTSVQVPISFTTSSQ